MQTYVIVELTKLYPVVIFQTTRAATGKAEYLVKAGSISVSTISLSIPSSWAKKSNLSLGGRMLR